SAHSLHSASEPVVRSRLRGSRCRHGRCNRQKLPYRDPGCARCVSRLNPLVVCANQQHQPATKQIFSNVVALAQSHFWVHNFTFWDSCTFESEIVKTHYPGVLLFLYHNYFRKSIT